MTEFKAVWEGEVPEEILAALKAERKELSKFKATLAASMTNTAYWQGKYEAAEVDRDSWRRVAKY